ncbi:hypothetical protein QAD02_022729 [Eretmocerus hayati]|uniref:Uncharacterized protein n=1 Tax=Eretmocerus hayati TaxID=131215 RepID=A0ACC2PTL1_9HYME|nr:hypothetical protein QAD02_022729 [Eretmocerus hayati]
MSTTTHCRQFVQNAWKKELCSNCFKPREEHVSPAASEPRPLIGRASNGAVKRVTHKVQGILRPRETTTGSSNQVRSKRKNVAFPDSLTEIIGYDGGDDGSDPADDYDPVDDEADSSSLGVDELPDSEEERALGNLTRANTNFNTVTANLNSPPPSLKETKSASGFVIGSESNSSIISSATKGLSSLGLGRTRKDADGKKTTLLVSVKPFGAEDTAVPTARRPNDKKPPEQAKSKPSSEIQSETKSVDPSIVKATRCIVEEKPSEAKTAKLITTATASASLGKIVDMPLITSSNLMSVMHEDGSQSSLDSQKSVDQKKATNINRTPAIKKPESEKPRVVMNLDQSASKNHKNLEISNSAGANSTDIKPPANELIVTKSNLSKESTKLTDLAERKVEGEATTTKPAYRFSESRESAGEPDGKADEEVVAEPPALPKSPPPCSEQIASCLRDKRQSQSKEPRSSFLHSVNSEPVSQKTTSVQSRPMVPSKPTSLPSMPRSSAPSLASLLSESRAYEYRLLNQASNTSQAELDRSHERRSSGGNQTDSSTDEHQRGDDEGDESEASLSEQPRSSKRRQAPQPPTSLNASTNSATEPESFTSSTSTAGNLFARNPVTPLKSSSDHCPVVREKEKRERSSSCSPKPRKAISSEPNPSSLSLPQQNQRLTLSTPPEPAPRRNISLSQDSLAAAVVVSSPTALYAGSVDEKKKHRSKFSLKKFLRMGSRKDVDMTCMRCDEIPSTPQPKPKLEIIHPLELDGAAVQVVRNDKSDGATTTESKNECPSNSPTSHFGPPHITARPSKPPPPPRAQSLDESSKSSARAQPNKPTQPQQQEQSSSTGKPVTSKSWQPNSGSSASDSIYANLAPEDVAGSTRSALAPAKPRRTSSMRDQTVLQLQTVSQPSVTLCNNATKITSNALISSSKVSSITATEKRLSVVTDVNGQTTYDSSISSESQSSDHHSSASECNNLSLELRQQINSGSTSSHLISKRQSDSGALESNSKHIKFQQNLFTRSTSLPYCASESDSEIYSPFSYNNGDEGSEDSCDRSDGDNSLQRLRLAHHQRHKRARSIVHRSLEDNYGAVIVANHESLAQLLERERAQPAPISPPGLRALKCTPKEPHLEDFTLDTTSVLPVARGRWIFVQNATWGKEQQLPCSLCMSIGPTRPATCSGPRRAEFRFEPIVEFNDDLPEKIAQLVSQQVTSTTSASRKNIEATIMVLPRTQVNTLTSFAASLGSSTLHQDAESTSRESSFVLLQLVSSLKSLQARGIEEAPADLGNVILCREDKQTYHRLYLLQGLNAESCESNQIEYASLCQCALNALEQLDLTKKLPLIRELLVREKAVTLSQVKSVLEFSLWGPSDAVGLGGPRERETALQRWLDLERATLLQALVRAPRAAQLELVDEYQLLFLVRTSAKIMCEASLLLDKQRNGLPFSCGNIRPAGSRPPAV